MAQQRRAAAPAAPPPDPFSGDFSQARVATNASGWPVIQWHGGLANLVGDGNSVKINGGFFIEDERVADLGFNPDQPVPGFERITLRLGGQPISGWGAHELQLAFIFSDFVWEDRETGKNRFPPREYERRKNAAPGTERELRGRTRCLVAVRELLDEGLVEPALLSMRGSYSAALNAILRDAKRMADEATKMRRRAGHDGAIPREAFWVPVYAGPMESVGEGSNTSRVALPKSGVPGELGRDFLVGQLVEEVHRRPGGTFDHWAESYGQVWEEKIAQGVGADTTDLPPTSYEEEYLNGY
jgi:hypothetical protein